MRACKAGGRNATHKEGQAATAALAGQEEAEKSHSHKALEKGGQHQPTLQDSAGIFTLKCDGNALQKVAGLCGGCRHCGRQ